MFLNVPIGSSGAGSATQLSSVLAGASTSARAATMHDDRAFQSLDRHTMHIVAAFVDGASRRVTARRAG